MPRFIIPLIVPMISVALAAPAFAAEGELRTLVSGTYACELPGDATGPVGRRVPEQDFVVINASGYRAQGKRGSYLLTGSRVVMTSGPLRGQLYRRVSPNVLHAVSRDGIDTRLRCIRARGAR